MQRVRIRNIGVATPKYMTKKGQLQTYSHRASARNGRKSPLWPQYWHRAFSTRHGRQRCRGRDTATAAFHGSFTPILGKMLLFEPQDLLAPDCLAPVHGRCRVCCSVSHLKEVWTSGCWSRTCDRLRNSCGISSFISTVKLSSFFSPKSLRKKSRFKKRRIATTFLINSNLQWGIIKMEQSFPWMVSHLQ